MGGQRHTPAALPLGKGPGSHFTGGWVDRGDGKVSPSAGFESRTVQPVGSSFTDCAVPAAACVGLCFVIETECAFWLSVVWR